MSAKNIPLSPKMTRFLACPNLEHYKTNACNNLYIFFEIYSRVREYFYTFSPALVA